MEAPITVTRLKRQNGKGGLLLSIMLFLSARLCCAAPIVGGVEQLSPRLDALRGGDGTAAPEVNKWFIIPDWLAGYWESSDSLVVSEVDERKKAEDKRMHSLGHPDRQEWGFQKDSKNRAWHYAYAKDEEMDGELERNSLLEFKPVAETSNRFVTKVLRTRWIKNKEGRITTTIRSESLCTISPIDHEFVVEDSDTRDFDSDGFPTKTRRTLTIFRKTADFEQKDWVRKVNMKALFRRYLLDEGRIDSIPKQ